MMLSEWVLHMATAPPTFTLYLYITASSITISGILFGSYWSQLCGRVSASESFWVSYGITLTSNSGQLNFYLLSTQRCVTSQRRSIRSSKHWQVTHGNCHKKFTSTHVPLCLPVLPYSSQWRFVCLSVSLSASDFYTGA